MVRVDIYYHTIDVDSYPCQLVPMSTGTTNRCQFVPQVMSTRTQQGVYDGTLTTQQSTRTIIRCQLVPNIIFWRIINVRYTKLVIFSGHVARHVKL